MATTALARRFAVDVSSDNATWLRFPGMTDFNPQITPTKQDSTTYDTNGWQSNEITLQAWSLTMKALRQPTAGVYPPAQEMVRACQGQFGDAARVYTRWYDKSGAAEAWTGRAIVEWNESKTGVADLNEIQVVLTGDGILTAITNPGAPTAVPVIVSATPSGAAAAASVTITGVGFTGTTLIKFGTVTAPTYTIVSDSTIVVTMPAGSAGSAPIVVTNASGASAAFAYTRS